MHYKTPLALGLATALNIATSPVYADTVIGLSYGGWFTLQQPVPFEDNVLNNSDATDQGFYGRRTAISGAISFNLETGTGIGTMAAFSFFGGGLFQATNISMQVVGDGAGGAGPLVLGNLGFNWGDWNENYGSGKVVPVSIVWDASGFFDAANGGLSTSDLISGAGALPATDDLLFTFGKNSYTLPLGPAPIATTTFNTTDIGMVTLGSNPSGTVPFTDDGVGGSPMKTGPFPDFSASFDIMDLQVTSITSTVPIPTTVWLFGSGLLGLIGVARREKA